MLRRLSTLTALAALAALASLALAGCTQGGGAAQPTGSPAPGGGSARDAVVQRAVADAATRSRVPPAQVRTVRAVDQEWRDGSLGCPAPDRSYTQAIVPGYSIELEAAGRRLSYHADRQGTLIFCDGGRPVAVQ